MSLPKFMLPLQPLAPRAEAHRPRASGRKLAPAPMGGGARGSLNAFFMERQLQSEWCWAAVGTSVGNYYRRQQAFTQCRVATGVLRRYWPQINCCGGASGQCNRPGSLDEPLMFVGHYRSRHDNRVPFNSVVGEIAGGRPFGVRIVWQGGGGHFVVIGGWSLSPANVAFVDVFDPLFSFVQLPVSQFANAYRGAGRWANSYYTRPQVGPMIAGANGRGKKRKSAPTSA
jgi:hypothetical protein